MAGQLDAGEFAVEWVDVETLRPDPDNAMGHPDDNIAAIAWSLRRFGFQKPLVVTGDGIVRAGNGTLAAALSIGLRRVPIHRTALSGPEAKAFAIADNRTATLPTSCTIRSLGPERRLSRPMDLAAVAMQWSCRRSMSRSYCSG